MDFKKVCEFVNGITMEEVIIPNNENKKVQQIDDVVLNDVIMERIHSNHIKELNKLYK